MPGDDFRLKDEEVQGPEVPLECQNPLDDDDRMSFFEQVLVHPHSFHQKHRPTYKKSDAGVVYKVDEEKKFEKQIVNDEIEDFNFEALSNNPDLLGKKISQSSDGSMDTLTLPFGENKPTGSLTAMVKKVRTSFTLERIDESPKDRAYTT